MNYVYIVAFGRSGSTLLADLLARNKAYLSVGEFFPGIVYRNPGYLCSCKKAVINCDFHATLQRLLSKKDRELIRRGDRLLNKRFSLRMKLGMYPTVNDVAALLLQFFTPPELKEYSLTINKLIDSLMSQSSEEVFIDASKQYYLLHTYLQNGFSNIKVLHLYRNPLGVYASRKRTESVDIRKFCTAYNKYFKFNRQFQHYRQVENYIEVDYEDLILQSRETMGRITSFIGTGEELRLTNSLTHIGGNSSRMRDNKVLSLDKRWKTELDSREIEYLMLNTCYPF